MTRASTPAPTPAPAPRPGGASAPARPRQAGPMIDPIRVLRQNLWRIVAVFVGGAALGVALTFVLASAYPLWSAKVMIEIKSQLESASELNPKDIGTDDTVVRLAQTEVARLISKDNLNKALDTPEILKTVWAESYRDANGNFVKEEATLDLEDEVRAGHQRGTQIFFISWRTHVPEDAPIVLNAIADTYIKTRRMQDESRFATFQTVYNKKRDEIDEAIKDKKKEIQQRISDKGLTSLTEGNSENQRTLESQRNDIAQTSAELAAARVRLAQAEKKAKGEDKETDEDDRRVDEDPAILQLIRERDDANRTLETLRKSYGESHNVLIEATARAEAASSAVDENRRKILERNLQAEYKAAGARVSSLEAVLADQQNKLKDFVKKVEGFTNDMADIRAMQDELEVMQERKKEVSKTLQEVALALDRAERNRIEIVQRALRPREISFPQLKVMIPATAVVLAGLYVLILFVRELLDQRVKYPSDLLALPGKLLGVIPEIGGDPAKPKRTEMVVRESPQSITAESYRQFAAQVSKGLASIGGKTVMVLGAMPEAGATTVALNLAMCEAAIGRHVLIVGANMRRPGLARALGQPAGSPGLGEVLAGEDPASVIVSVAENVDMMPVGAPASRVFERLNTPRLDEVLAWAKEHYDLVVIDAPPSVVASESLIIANKVDAALVVARAWQDQRGLVMKLCGQLLDSRCQLLGVVLNRMRMTAGGYLRKNAEAIADYAERTTAFGGTDEVERQKKKKEPRKAAKKPA